LKGMALIDGYGNGVLNNVWRAPQVDAIVADFLKEWFLADACDGFSVVPDLAHDGVAFFLNLVIPILQDRGIFHREYEGKTLSENMGVPYQYGSAIEERIQMNNTLELLHNHTSIRSYTNQPLEEEQVEAIFKAANQTSSFSLLQAVSIIRIADPDLRKKVMQLFGYQPYIEEAAEFWIFCADFNRNHRIAPDVDLDYIEFLLIGSFDAGLMAQNALTAAESMGLGGVYIGGVRLNITELTEALHLPKYVVPLVGQCIGYPAGEKPGLKPRLPQSMVMFDNQYQPLDEEKLEAYDLQMREYYQDRPVSAPFTVKRVKGWKDHIEDHLERSNQPFMLEYLNKQGFAKK